VAKEKQIRFANFFSQQSCLSIGGGLYPTPIEEMEPAAAENPLCGFFHEINSLCEFFLLEAGDILLTLYFKSNTPAKVRQRKRGAKF